MIQCQIGARDPQETRPEVVYPIDRVEELGIDMTRRLGERIAAFQILGHLFESKRNLGMNECGIGNCQESKLRRIVSHAYQAVPFYRELFNKHKVNPDDIQSMSDLNKLPIITKNVLRRVPSDQRISRSFIHKPLTKCFTGGSTGEPFTVYLSKEEINRRTAHWFRIFFLHGCNVFDKSATVAGMSGRVGTHWFNRLGLLRKIEVPFDCSMSDQVEIILNKKPEILVGYPSRLYLLAKYIGDNHIRIETPKAIFSDSETLLPRMRKTTEEAFGVKVTNVYDSYEFGFTAWECEKHKGLHIDSDSQVVQIIKDNVELEDGQSGDIVVTDLDNYAMPLIRYEIGDIGTKSNRKCDCGIAFPLLESVQGRKWDFLLSPTGEEIAPLVVEQFVRRHEGILEYQVVQNSRGTLNVEIVASKDYDYDTDAQIQRQLKELYNFREIVIHHPSHIQRTKMGKLRCVIRNF